MADATIVVETAVKGGSMITAELANGYSRDVFAFPGKITDNKSAGCNHLIKNNKAILLTDAAHLVEMLGWNTKKAKPKKQKELFISLTSDEQVLVEVLKAKDTVHIDEIFLKSGLTSSTVAAGMLNLEFQNVVASLPGKMYKLL
jgi:DNA processing protein